MNRCYVDGNRRTCITYAEGDGLVFAVKMDTPELGLLEVGALQFHSLWTEIEADPVKAALQYRDGFIPFNSEIASILESIIMATKAKAPSKAVVTDGEGNQKATAKGKKETAAAAKAKAFFDKAEKAVGAEDAKPAKAKAEKAPKEAKEPKARAPKEDISGKKIVLLPAAEGKRFQEGSIRSMCFAKIKDGMTVKAYLAAVAKAEICDEKAATDCLKKLIDTTQKTPTVELA